jgi:TolA-binding protein
VTRHTRANPVIGGARAVGILVGLAVVLLACGGAVAQEAKPESDADLQFEFANKLFQIKAYKTAGAEFRRFLRDYREDPRREEARYHLALCHFQMGEPKEYTRALAELATLRKEFPAGKFIQDCLFRSGHIRYLLADAKGAIADLSALQKLEVRSDLIIPMHHFLGRAHHDLGRHEQAVAHLSLVAKAPKESPLRQFALVVLADAQLKRKRVADSASAIETLLRDYPQVPNASEMWLKLGDARLVLKQYKPALEAYAKAPKDGPGRDRAMLGQARAMLGLKQYPQATDAARTLLKSYKETPETKGLQVPAQCWYIIGLAAFNREQYQPAAEAFTSVLARVKQGAMAEDSAHKLCWCYFRLGPKYAKRLVAGSVEFRRLFPRSRWAPRIVFITAEGYLWLEDYENAIAYYKRVDAKDENYADALYRIAYCYHKQKNADAAARAYDAFVAKFGKADQAQVARVNAAGLYQASGKFDLAIERYRSYLAGGAKGPAAEEAAYQIGVCFARQGKFAEMAKAFAHYVKVHPRGRYAGTAWYWLGRHHRTTGDERSKQRDHAGAAAAYAQAEAALDASLKHAGVDRDTTLLALAECRYSLGNKRMDWVAELTAKAGDAPEAEQKALAAQIAGLEKEADAALALSAQGFLDLMTRKPEMIKNEAVFFWAGTFFRTRGDAQTAITVFQAFRKQFPQSKQVPAALFQLVRLYHELKPPDHEGVIKHADALLEAAPDGVYAMQARHAKADALYAKKQWRDAEKLYLEVYNRGAEPLKVAATMRLGHIGFALEEYAAAARYFAQIGLLYKDESVSPEALYFAGKANRMLEEPGELTKFWQLLLQTYGKTTWAKSARDELAEMGYTVNAKNEIQPK